MMILRVWSAHEALLWSGDTPPLQTRCSFLPRVIVGQFFAWLERQRARNDDVGQYARNAVANVRYPRSSRLLILLKYEPDATRDALKKAHREWRREHERQIKERSA
jgi:hypothetical protein